VEKVTRKRAAHGVWGGGLNTPAGERAVVHPAHYTYGKYECLDVIVGQGFPFLVAQVIKYLWRHEHKGRPLEDLKKARFYLERLIQEHEREE
jgi:Protein of unknwon function (DUF3310)